MPISPGLRPEPKRPRTSFGPHLVRPGWPASCEDRLRALSPGAQEANDQSEGRARDQVKNASKHRDRKNLPQANNPMTIQLKKEKTIKRTLQRTFHLKKIENVRLGNLS